MRYRAPGTSRRSKAFAGLLAFSLLAAACGGAKEGESGGGGENGGLEEAGLNVEAGESGLKDAGDPVRGGSAVYGLEADTNGGFCLSEAQLAISGMMVVRAIYDTLTVPNAEGDYVPYLAESIEPNEDYTEWTIKVREGVTFHDGSPLTAEVVKNNIDAYRGVYPGRSSLLFAFVLNNIAETAVVDETTMTVTTEKPWVSFPAFLFSSSRFGIMAQAQLDDPETCGRKPIGTGPFKFVSWTPNQSFKAERNPDYWQMAPDGEPYPYLDAIEFRPIPDGQVRGQAIQAGDVDLIHTSNAADIGNKFKDLRDDGKANMLVSEDTAEVAFIQLNHTEPPFDDLRMRQAMAMAANREEINQIIGDGLPTIADGPFAPDSIAYLEDPGFPKFDAAKAKELVAEYEAEGGKAEFTLTATSDPTVRKLAELVQQRAQAAGVNVKIALRDQAAIINDAIGKKYQAMLFRNYPGGDPDINYVWWHGGEPGDDPDVATNPVNFAGFNDPEVNKLLDEGRGEPDQEKRKQIYQDLNRRMATQVHGLWSWYTPWAIVTQPNVHNIFGPPLPGENPGEAGEETTDDPARQPNQGLATAHSLLGIWIEE
ncbi:MAG TPA: ABC transporter substrate-binding protein [Aquihabitans sp.]|jgi:peptide/nickel transport system substrate-binding protein|nr:ABC transporter substrate-binding protein [Aquihabitans sp.]